MTKTPHGSQSVTFRKATLADVPVMASLCAFHYETENYWHGRIAGYLKNEFNPYLSLDPRLVYVAVHDETVIGFVACHLTSRTEYIGQIQWLCVDPGHQRAGIGTTLLSTVFRWFIDHGAFSVRADIEPHELNLRQFYKKHGAESLNKYWLFWVDINTIS